MQLSVLPTLALPGGLLSITSGWSDNGSTWASVNPSEPSWSIPTGWSWDATNCLISKDTAASADMVYSGPASTIKTLLIVTKLIASTGTFSTWFTSDDNAGSHCLYNFNATYFTGNNKNGSGNAGAAREMLDSSILAAGNNTTTNPNDGTWHVAQWTQLDLSSWAQLAFGSLGNLPQCKHQAGTKVALIAAYNVNLSDAQMQQNWASLQFLTGYLNSLSF